MFGDKLRKFREEQGLTQEEFAKVVGISRSIISQLESNIRPASKQSLIKLADYSGKPIEWWLGDNEEVETRDLQALNALLDYMVEKDMFGENGEIGDKEMEYIKRMLQAEIRNKMEKRKKPQA